MSLPKDDEVTVDNKTAACRIAVAACWLTSTAATTTPTAVSHQIGNEFNSIQLLIIDKFNNNVKTHSDGILISYFLQPEWMNE